MPPVMPDNILIGRRPELPCPAEIQMILPNSVTMPLALENRLSEAETHLPSAHLALLLVVALAAEDQVAGPLATATAGVAQLVATSIAFAGGAALGPHASDEGAARALLAGELGAADRLAVVSSEVRGVTAARAHNHFGGLG